MPIYRFDHKGGRWGEDKGLQPVLVWLRSGSTATPGGSTTGGFLKRLTSRSGGTAAPGGSTAAVPLERRAALNEWHTHLKRSVVVSFANADDRMAALMEDRQGLGVSRRSRA